ncbi:MAG: MBOAT family protein [Clostridia bacterium]|nr:MBOAT family protein [Clostridia bacterium]
MLFSSLEFLYLFLPLTVGVYFLLPSGAKNYVLLLASLIFYGIAQPRLLPLMLAVALFDYGAGLLIWREMARGREKRANVVCAFAIVANILTLFIFKYLDAVFSLFGAKPLGIELPVGISFYTFQAMSYVIDVRRRAAWAQKNPFTFVTYVTLFPQLVAGPIVRYCEVDASLADRRHSVSGCAEGVRIFCVGLAKKILLANGAGEQWERLARYSTEGGTVLGAWLGIVFFAFQIYFDFSGYSDMARGLGKIFGFEFPENFRYPYVSRSITEFWRRWHITLSSWFREYVYIPLGGNRGGRLKTYRNLFITWLLTGVWHGAAFNFILWGLYFFLLLAIEKAFLLKVLEKAPRVVSHLYALFFILIGWLIFASDGGTLTAAEGARYFGQLFGVGCELVNADALFELSRSLTFLAIAAVAATPLPARIVSLLLKKRETAVTALMNIAAVASLVICTCYLADLGYNPFLYFKF